ncbi:MAG: lipid-A-disaccharide synthase [Nitrospirae bacterium]|nr:lipid-A-disaccharide synthase [Nitrospirota bacterium]
MKKILMIAGEASGDIYGAELAKNLFSMSDVNITGIGGDRMRNAGVEILYDASNISVVGVSEILPKFSAIRKAYNLVKDLLKSHKIDMVVLIDYPGFNIRIAGVAKSEGIPVVYYISPQIWAWKKGRLHKIAERVNKMIVILPFEEALYKDAGVDCTFAGHPLVDEILNTGPVEQTLQKYKIVKGKPVIGLLPGSRPGEINSLLTDMLEAARILKETNPDIQLVMAVAETLDFDHIRDIVSKSPVGVKMMKGEANDVLNISDVIIAASGTITLQAALFEKPMVVLYRVSALTYAAAKLLVKIKDICIVNILAGKRIVPEMLQADVKPDRIAEEVRRMLDDKGYYEKIKKDLHEVKMRLGPPGASLRAAEVIAKMLDSEQKLEARSKRQEVRGKK